MRQQRAQGLEEARAQVVLPAVLVGGVAVEAIDRGEIVGLQLVARDPFDLVDRGACRARSLRSCLRLREVNACRKSSKSRQPRLRQWYWKLARGAKPWARSVSVSCSRWNSQWIDEQSCSSASPRAAWISAVITASRCAGASPGASNSRGPLAGVTGAATTSLG
ncbi:MAG: hypothetical protein U0168_11810 [Nannocystaceae bacterium]